MTTRTAAEALLFEKPEDVVQMHNVSLPEPITTRRAADELANLHRGANFQRVGTLSLRQALELLIKETRAA